jgi:hypothetical protein
MTVWAKDVREVEIDRRSVDDTQYIKRDTLFLLRPLISLKDASHPSNSQWNRLVNLQDFVGEGARLGMPPTIGPYALARPCHPRPNLKE